MITAAPRWGKRDGTITTTPEPNLQDDRYTAHTNQGFLLREASIAAQRLLDGWSFTELERAVREDDLFEIRAAKSRATYLRALRQRLEGVPQELLELLAEGSLDLRRLTNFYLILLRHRLLREFMAEVVYEQLLHFRQFVPPTEIRVFFTRKAIDVPEVGAWSEATLQKASSNILKLAVEAGLLRERGKNEPYAIVPVHVPERLRGAMFPVHRDRYLTLMLDRS